MKHAPGQDDAGTLVRAAVYVRMSTSQQVQSPRLQEAYLRRYADAHAMQVVRMYSDEGRSGLVLAGRGGLQRLLSDIAANLVDFSALLIYDVSRWGRYQDPDEAGFYEFLCRKAGIRLIYCAEQFANDGSLYSQLMKNLKRGMAAEYSRELSAKVFAAQRRLAYQGYKQGGAAMYGLRRIALSADGMRSRELVRGECKPRSTDRVTLAPGGEEELGTIRYIFQLFNREGLTMSAIVRRLNAEKIDCDGKLWTNYRVQGVLSKEHYWGNLVYNRTSAQMKTARVINPREQWVRRENALDAIVSPADGRLAAEVRRMRNGQDIEAVLKNVRAIYAKHGIVTNALLSMIPGMPGSRRLSRMFGSLTGTYLAAGLPPRRKIGNVKPPQLFPEMIKALRDRVCTMVYQAGGMSEIVPGTYNLLLLNGSLLLRISIVCCHRYGNHPPDWATGVGAGRKGDFVLAGLLDEQNCRIARYGLIASAQKPRKVIHFGSKRSGKAEVLLYPDLHSLFGLPALANAVQ